MMNDKMDMKLRQKETIQGMQNLIINLKNQKENSKTKISSRVMIEKRCRERYSNSKIKARNF